MVWLTGGSLIIAFFMIVGLLLLIFLQGVVTFWPSPLVQVYTKDGHVFMGEITRTQKYRPGENVFASLSPEIAAEVRKEVEQAGGEASRRLVRTGNFDLTNTHFHWVDEVMIEKETRPEWGLVIERFSWGRFYGTPQAFYIDGKPVTEKPEEVFEQYAQYRGEIRESQKECKSLETHEIGAVNRKLENARLGLQSMENKYGKSSEEYAKAKENFEKIKAWTEGEFTRIRREIRNLHMQNDRYAIGMKTAQNQEKIIRLSEIVRSYPANQLDFFGKLGIYGSRWWEFVTANPREANSEGGVFPAIFGTVAMTLLMSLAVVPFGVLAALYLREYAKAGLAVSAVQIAVNNLAGVPSIVFGVFGLGFFCYIIGGSLDALLFSASLPNPTYGKGGILWASFTLALLTLPVVIVATEEALAAVPNSMREGSYACGASKWQTIKRIVLPRAMPGIMTGMILAIARGAGEVAPLMLVGAVKAAPKLPVDRVFPFLHPQRSFMHLGFHIYDLGFQSQNSEAAKPMVFTTTLLLIVIVALLNIMAFWLRTRLLKRYVTGEV